MACTSREKDITFSVSTEFIAPLDLHLELKSPFKHASQPKRKHVKPMNCKSPSLCLPPLNPLQRMRSPTLHMLQFSGEPWLEYGSGYNQEFFFNLAGPKVWCFFSNLKANFLIVTLLFCRQNFTIWHHSAKFFLKKKKSTCHNVTRLAANQFIKHIQLKSI